MVWGRNVGNNARGGNVQNKSKQRMNSRKRLAESACIIAPGLPRSTVHCAWEPTKGWEPEIQQVENLRPIRLRVKPGKPSGMTGLRLGILLLSLFALASGSAAGLVTALRENCDGQIHGPRKVVDTNNTIAKPTHALPLRCDAPGAAGGARQ